MDERGWRELLISIVNPGRNPLNVNSVSLTAALDGGRATGMGSVLWGNGDWALSAFGSLTKTSGLPPLSVDLFMKGGTKPLGGIVHVGSNVTNGTYGAV